jgi:uncharacterized membrane protein YdjX (TVP38/TMEM64 family)
MVFAGFSRDKRHSRRHVAGMRRFLPLLILLLLFCAALVVLPGRGVGWESLARHQDMLIGWVAAHPFGAPALYMAAYILTAALSLPQAALVTVAGGLLFGAVAGCALTVSGATIGASILLLVIRSAFSKTLERQRQRIPANLQARVWRATASAICWRCGWCRWCRSGSSTSPPRWRGFAWLCSCPPPCWAS